MFGATCIIIVASCCRQLLCYFRLGGISDNLLNMSSAKYCFRKGFYHIAYIIHVLRCNISEELERETCKRISVTRSTIKYDCH